MWNWMNLCCENTELPAWRVLLVSNVKYYSEEKAALFHKFLHSLQNKSLRKKDDLLLSQISFILES